MLPVAIQSLCPITFKSVHYRQLPLLGTMTRKGSRIRFLHCQPLHCPPDIHGEPRVGCRHTWVPQPNSLQGTQVVEP